MSGLIHIDIEYHVTLTVDELYPDGDAPEVIDREMVMDLMKQEGLRNVPTNWGFDLPDVHIGFSGVDLNTGRTKHYADKLAVLRDSGSSDENRSS